MLDAASDSAARMSFASDGWTLAELLVNALAADSEGFGHLRQRETREGELGESVLPLQPDTWWAAAPWRGGRMRRQDSMSVSLQCMCGHGAATEQVPLRLL